MTAAPTRALRARDVAHPLATAGVLFAVLATVRIGGAYLPAALLVSFVLTPAVLLAAPPGELPAMGLRPPRTARSVVAGVAVVVLAYAVTVAGCVVAFGVGGDNWASGLLTVFDGVLPPTLPGHRLLTVAVVVASLGLVVPLVEEVCFRGFFLHAVSSRLGPVAAVVVTSAAWALVHLGDYGLRPLNLSVILGVLASVFAMGLALGWCRLWTGSVLACVAAQGGANLLLAVWVSTW